METHALVYLVQLDVPGQQRQLGGRLSKRMDRAARTDAHGRGHTVQADIGVDIDDHIARAKHGEKERPGRSMVEKSVVEVAVQLAPQVNLKLEISVPGSTNIV